MARFCNRLGPVLAAVSGPTILIVAAAISLAFSPVSAQPQSNSAGSQPPVATRTIDGHPDLNGFWRTSDSPNSAAPANLVGSAHAPRTKPCDDDTCQDPNQPVYKPKYMNEVRTIAKGQVNGVNPLDPRFECKPLGVPRGSVGAMEIVQSGAALAVLYEGSPVPIYRTIFLDGRQHPKNLVPSYMGDSIGHWQGDSLVIDVAGLNAETWLGGGLPGVQKYTSIHSDQEHVIERWTRRGNIITYEATVEDPVMLSNRGSLLPVRCSSSPTATNCMSVLALLSTNPNRPGSFLN